MTPLETDSTIPLKKCCSCRENLPYDQFGELHSSSDGFNSTCKPCRSTIRRRHHQNSLLGFPNRITPKLSLRDYNSSTLDSLIGGVYMGTHTFTGYGVNDRLAFKLVLDLQGELSSFKILDSQGKLVYRLDARLAFGWTSIKTGIVNLLLDNEIKLEKKD